MDPLTITYFVALAIGIIIRAPFHKRRKQEKIGEQRITIHEKIALSLLLLGGFIIPLIYAATNWLDFANYRLPTWAGRLGVLLIAGAIFIFRRAHADLGPNWSPTLEIREKHELITRGIYGVIRHPMYASQWLVVIAQPLLLHNWIAGFSYLFAFISFYFPRVKAEEQMMLDTFGAQYQEYMRTTGGVLPRI